MIPELIFTRQIPLPGSAGDYNLARLDEELRPVEGFTGLSSANGLAFASLLNTAPAESEQSILALAALHDKGVKAASEVEEEAREADLDEVRPAKVIAALEAIAQERQRIDAGKTALVDASNLAQIKTIIGGILDVLDNIDARQARIIKAVGRMVR